MCVRMTTKVHKILLLLLGVQWSVFVFTQEIDTITIKTIACETLQEAYTDKYQHELLAYDTLDYVSIQPIISGGITYFYAANVRNEQGWALVSNEERYVPVVAYSLRGNIDTSNPDSLWYRFLQEHIDAIDSIRLYNISTPRISKKRQRIMNGMPASGTTNRVILPVIGDLEWYQGFKTTSPYYCDYSYNRYCPEKDGSERCGKAPVGCTGVAMAMIMKYWKWPDYTKDDSLKIHYIDWDILPNDILDGTISAAHMLAHLLYDCGVAANSHYRKEYTWATIGNARDGFKNKLGYTDTEVVFGGMWGVFDWISNPIKAEIDAGRPVFCQGWTKALDPSDSHSFVIYGYEEKGDEFKFCANMGHGFSESAVWCTLDSVIGYNRERSILTGLRPKCSSRSNLQISLDTTIINNGDLHTEYSTATILYGPTHPIVVKSGGRLIAQASDRIVLLPGFRAEYGSCAQLTIKQFCDEGGSYVRLPAIHNFINSYSTDNLENNVEEIALSQSKNFFITPNPVNKMLNIHAQNELSLIKIYNLNGQCVMQAAQTDIDVSALPQGMYILRAVTIDSIPLQAKFIKQ